MLSNQPAGGDSASVVAKPNQDVNERMGKIAARKVPSVSGQPSGPPLANVKKQVSDLPKH